MAVRYANPENKRGGPPAPMMPPMMQNVMHPMMPAPVVMHPAGLQRMHAPPMPPMAVMAPPIPPMAIGGMVAVPANVQAVPPAPGMGKRGPPGANLYVNNLSPYINEVQIRQLFGDYGQVASVKLFTQHGYGFVSFENPQSALIAMQSLNGAMLAAGLGNGRPLEVSFKKEKNAPAGVRFEPY
jgi:hypothetical protein